MIILSSCVKDFLSHCKIEKGLSDKTLKAYGTDLGQFSKFAVPRMETDNIFYVNKTIIREYISSMSQLKPKSVKRKVASVKAMFNYLEFEESVEKNPFRKMRLSIREPKNLPSVLTLTEVTKVLSTVYLKAKTERSGEYTKFERLRNIVIIELLFSTGARVSEISNLMAKSIDFETGTITIRGKGNKERLVQICNEECIRVLVRYHTLYGSRIEKSGGYFLTNRENGRLSEQSIRNVIKSLASQSGLDKKVTPHTFRHSFATLLLENDVDIKYIQTMLGHSSIVTTQIYTHANPEKQKKILLLKHPRMGMTLDL